MRQVYSLLTIYKTHQINCSCKERLKDDIDKEDHYTSYTPKSKLLLKAVEQKEKMLAGADFTRFTTTLPAAGTLSGFVGPAKGDF